MLYRRERQIHHRLSELQIRATLPVVYTWSIGIIFYLSLNPWHLEQTKHSINGSRMKLTRLPFLYIRKVTCRKRLRSLRNSTWFWWSEAQTLYIHRKSYKAMTHSTQHYWPYHLHSSRNSSSDLRTGTDPYGTKDNGPTSHFRTSLSVTWRVMFHYY